MKRFAFASLAILGLLVSIAAPASANGDAATEQLTISVQGLPDKCPAGDPMIGELTIVLNDDGFVGARRVGIHVTVETPFGEVMLNNQTIMMERGSKVGVLLTVPVGSLVPTDTYSFKVTVFVKGDSAEVGHDAYIYSEG